MSANTHEERTGTDKSNSESIRKKLLAQLADADAAYCIVVSDVDTETGSASLSVARFARDDLPVEDKVAVGMHMDEAAISQAHPMAIIQTIESMGLPFADSSDDEVEESNANIGFA